MARAILGAGAGGLTVDDLQERLVRLGLSSLADLGFALAGGYALEAHGLVDRLSEDVDLFTDRWDPQDFARAVETLCAAYTRAGLEVTVTRQAETFARLQVTDPGSRKEGSVDLAADVRNHPTIRLSGRPVLAEDDAVANKTAAVFSRGEVRDYLDLTGILASGRYSREELMTLAADADAGFDRAIFAQALAGVDRFPDEEFVRYGIDAGQIATTRAAMRAWSQDLQQPTSASDAADPASADVESGQTQHGDPATRVRQGVPGTHTPNSDRRPRTRRPPQGQHIQPEPPSDTPRPECPTL